MNLIIILTYRKATHDCIVYKPKLTQELFASRELSQHQEDPRKRNNLCSFLLPQLLLFCTHFWRTSRPYFSARFSPCRLQSLVHSFSQGLTHGGACYLSLACLSRWLVCCPRDNPKGMPRAVCSFLSAGQARKILELVRSVLILSPNATLCILTKNTHGTRMIRLLAVSLSRNISPLNISLTQQKNKFQSFQISVGNPPLQLSFTFNELAMIFTITKKEFVTCIIGFTVESHPKFNSLKRTFYIYFLSYYTTNVK